MTGDETRGPAAPPHPVTDHDAEDRYGPGAYKARERFDELAGWDVQARAIAKLKARGEFDPARHSDPAKYPPLTLEERLELLALGEIIALHYRHPAQVHHALEAGAAWAQIAAARGTDEAAARRDYRAWADGQHHLWLDYQGEFGMNEAEHAAAIERAGRASLATDQEHEPSEGLGGGEIAGHARFG
jgi:hypothetical protein